MAYFWMGRRRLRLKERVHQCCCLTLIWTVAMILQHHHLPHLLHLFPLVLDPAIAGTPSRRLHRHRLPSHRHLPATLLLSLRNSPFCNRTCLLLMCLQFFHWIARILENWNPRVHASRTCKLSSLLFCISSSHIEWFHLSNFSMAFKLI